jgi:uncharacterized membrane protein
MTEVEKSVVVDVPVSTAYAQWTHFEDFPKFMGGVERVTPLGAGRLEWVAQVGGRRRQWVAQIVEQVPDQRISWTSVDGAVNGGEVSFDDVGSGQTEVILRLEYEPNPAEENVGDTTMMLDSQAEFVLENFQLFIEGYWSQIEGDTSDGDADPANEQESEQWLDGLGATIVSDDPGLDQPERT